ncbi:hypothetical protein FDECE_11001 [Fusarium decemcellulare]|nr:hypothetical protein FDECE_11001 [Fusarium decemcellulare]
MEENREARHTAEEETSPITLENHALKAELAAKKAELLAASSELAGVNRVLGVLNDQNEARLTQVTRERDTAQAERDAAKQTLQDSEARLKVVEQQLKTEESARQEKDAEILELKAKLAEQRTRTREEQGNAKSHLEAFERTKHDNQQLVSTISQLLSNVVDYGGDSETHWSRLIKTMTEALAHAQLGRIMSSEMWSLLPAVDDQPAGSANANANVHIECLKVFFELSTGKLSDDGLQRAISAVSTCDKIQSGLRRALLEVAPLAADQISGKLMMCLPLFMLVRILVRRWPNEPFDEEAFRSKIESRVGAADERDASIFKAVVNDTVLAFCTRDELSEPEGRSSPGFIMMPKLQGMLLVSGRQMRWVSLSQIDLSDYFKPVLHLSDSDLVLNWEKGAVGAVLLKEDRRRDTLTPSPNYPPEHPTATLGNFRGLFEVPESPTVPATPNVGGAELGRSPSPIRPLGSPSFRATPTPLGAIARGTAPALRSPSLGALGVSGRSRRIRSFASPSLASRIADQDTTMQDTFPSDNATQHTQPQETSVVWTRNAPVPVGTRVPPDQRCTWTHRQVAVLPGAPNDEEEEEDTSKLNNARLGNILGWSPTYETTAHTLTSQLPTITMSSESDAVIAVLLAYGAALKSRNVEDAVALYTADGVIMPPHFSACVGTDALRDTYTRIFSTSQLNASFTFEEVVIMSPEWAFARTTASGTKTMLATQASEELSNQELFVLKKEDGKWKISRYAFSTMKPLVQDGMRRS